MGGGGGMPCPSRSKHVFYFRTSCSGGVSDEAACVHRLPQPMVMGRSVSAVSANLAALCSTVYENIFYLPPPPPPPQFLSAAAADSFQTRPQSFHSFRDRQFWLWELLH